MQLIIIIAVIAYFFLAVASVTDKHIVSNTTLNPVAYAFYSGFFQILYILAAPIIILASPIEIRLDFPSWEVIFLGIIDGTIFIYALIALYQATAKGEISRITPMVGVLVPIFTFLLSAVFLKEVLSFRQFCAFFLFIIGGFLMSAKIEKNRLSYIKGASVAITAGFLFGLYYVLMDFIFTKSGFWEVFIILQLGGFVGAISLLASKKNREMIFSATEKDRTENKKTSSKAHGSIFFFINKGVSSMGSVLINYAISLGSATIVNSLQSIQYAFVLFFSAILSKRMPDFFNEQTDRKILAQKGIALVFTAIGLILIS